MPKVNKPGSQKSEQTTPKAAEVKKSTEQPTQQSTQNSTPAPTDKGKQSSKSNKPRIGGTAVTGAKSTQPKEIKATNPSKQEAESYNRTMRRRMQHIGAGAYAPDPVVAAQEKRKKRIERVKERKEERKEQAKKAIGPRFRVSLGRKTAYFLIGTIALIVIVIVLALIINHPFSR